MIASLLLFGTFVVLGIPTGLILLPWSLLTRDVMLLYRTTQMIVHAGYFLARIRVEVRGRESIPADTACIFMANHVSNLDPPALITNIPGRT
jgi:1-acyl-sn-glycerol-3-phosphate acyltransferase